MFPVIRTIVQDVQPNSPAVSGGMQIQAMKSFESTASICGRAVERSNRPFRKCPRRHFRSPSFVDKPAPDGTPAPERSTGIVATSATESSASAE